MRWLFAVLAVALLLARLPSVVQPAGGDQGIYAYVGQSILRGEVPYRDALETAYLYCRGFDLTTIATTKNLPLKSVRSRIKKAASRFEQSKQELCLEFNLTDTELHRLYTINHSDVPVAA